MFDFKCKGLAGSILLHAMAVGFWHFNTERLAVPAPNKTVEIELIANNEIASSEELPASDAVDASIPGTDGTVAANSYGDTGQLALPSHLEEKLVLPPHAEPYLHPSAADIRAQPVEPVIVPFPEGSLDRPKGVAILILYIGIDGKVDRIEIDKSELPTIFEQAAISAFMQAKMYPAIKGGEKVKSIMKVLVEFEQN